MAGKICQPVPLDSEKKFNGFKTVLESTGETHGFMDLETLFNTVIEIRDKVTALFEKGADHAD